MIDADVCGELQVISSPQTHLHQSFCDTFIFFSCCDTPVELQTASAICADINTQIILDLTLYVLIQKSQK